MDEQADPTQGGLEGAESLESYAAERGLAIRYGGHLPRVMPLLARGDRRHADAILEGWLSKNIEGKIALYTRVDVYRDSNGRRHTSERRFTLCLTHVPKAKRFLPRLLCERKSGFRALEGVEDALLHADDRVRLESEALDQRYEIFVSPEHDESWLRQLFEPSFIVWLTDEAPPGFAFEYVDGKLCVSLEEHRTSPAELDALRDATIVVVRRLRQEVRESLGPAKGRHAPGKPGFPPASV